MVGTLAGLHDHLKLAREYALEGLYDTSIIFFDGAIAQINKHLSTLDDPIIRTKWMNCKKGLSEEIDIVKQLDAERRSFKEIPGSRRATSPPISSKSGGFVFQPLDEYPTSSVTSADDPDVWRPPSRDPQQQYANRRSTRTGQAGVRKSSQDATWARGSARPGTAVRGAKSNASSRTNSGVRASTASGLPTKKGNASARSNSSKTDSLGQMGYALFLEISSRKLHV